MNRKIAFALIGLVVLLLGYFLVREGQQEDLLAANTYTNNTYGISFSYPEGYTLTEREVGDAHRGHHVITLLRTEDATPREHSEGPTGITIDIVDNQQDTQSLIDWVTATNFTNFKMGDGVYEETTIAGVPAVMHTWSGLYEAEVTAFLTDTHAVAVTRTRISPDDHADAYEEILSSMSVRGEVLQ